MGEDEIRVLDWDWGLDLEARRGRFSLKLLGENHLWGLDSETMAVAMEYVLDSI